jgi:hypothetical protein
VYFAANNCSEQQGAFPKALGLTPFGLVTAPNEIESDLQQVLRTNENSDSFLQLWARKGKLAHAHRAGPLEKMATSLALLDSLPTQHLPTPKMSLRRVGIESFWMKLQKLSGDVS